MAVTDRNKFDFTEPWFENNIEDWEHFLGGLRGKKINVLEIGAFEGASTTWILEELLTSPDSRMITVDTFEGSIENHSPQGGQASLPVLEKRFRENIKKTGRENQLTVLKSDSYKALVDLNHSKSEPFDLIYIDGSHVARDVLSDVVLVWPLLETGGFLVFDDYRWDYYKEPYNNPRLAIDSFLNCFAQDVKVVYKRYQVIVQKVTKTDTFTVIDPSRKL